MERFLFVDLAGLTPGKPFAGFAAGTFVDMNGREVEFKASTLRTFMANTLKAIAASTIHPAASPLSCCLLYTSDAADE